MKHLLIILIVCCSLAFGQTTNPTPSPVPVYVVDQPNSTVSSLVKVAPVRFVMTPIPPKTLKPILKSDTVGVSTLSICNSSVHALNIPLEQIVSNLPNINYLPYDQAEQLISLSYGKNIKLRLVNYGGYLALAATAVLAGGSLSHAFTISPKIIGYVGGGIPLMTSLGNKLKGEVPSISQYAAQTLSGAVNVLPAGQSGYCETKIIFSALAKNQVLAPIDLTVDVPYTN
jgi:hypothetical protein